MKLGFTLPLIGKAASAEAVVQVAKRAEELGYDSLWTTERFLYAQAPQSGFAGIPGLAIPEAYKIALNSLVTLTFAAANTSHIRLGTSVLVMGYYNPVLLARSLTTLDILSGGRLTIGLGQGWSKDEFDVVGVAMDKRGKRADEFLQVLLTIWSNEVVDYKGKYFQIPKSTILPKPIQKPHPPIYLAAFSPGAIQRAGKYADGYNPPFLPNPEIWEGIKAAAKAAGRNPDDLKILVRAHVNVTDQPAPKDPIFGFNGSLEQVKEDIDAAKAFGVDELFFDPAYSPAGETLDGTLKLMEELKALAS